MLNNVVFFLFKFAPRGILTIGKQEHFGMSKKRRYRKLRGFINQYKKPVLIGVVALVVFGILVTVAALLSQNNSEDGSVYTQQEIEDRDARKAESERYGALINSANDALDKGDTSGADKVYEEAIESEQDVVRKILLYKDQSQVLYNNGKFQQAIDIMKEADKLSEDKFIVADWLSRLYEDQKNYKQAEKYYRLAAEWADSETNTAKISKEYLEKQADRVAKLRKD